MDTKDRFMEKFLTIKDAVLNIFTLGWWSHHQGSKRIAVYK